MLWVSVPSWGNGRARSPPCHCNGLRVRLDRAAGSVVGGRWGVGFPKTVPNCSILFHLLAEGFDFVGQMWGSCGTDVGQFRDNCGAVVGQAPGRPCRLAGYDDSVNVGRHEHKLVFHTDMVVQQFAAVKRTGMSESGFSGLGGFSGWEAQAAGFTGWQDWDWSGRLDSNQRPPAPHAGALPSCATPRPCPGRIARGATLFNVGRGQGAVESGEWRVESGEWRVGSGEWGQWRVSSRIV